MSEVAKTLTVAQLRTAIDQLADDDVLLLNSQGNLAVLDSGLQYVAWIALGEDGDPLHWCTGDDHDARRFRRRLEHKRRRELIRPV